MSPTTVPTGIGRYANPREGVAIAGVLAAPHVVRSGAAE